MFFFIFVIEEMRYLIAVLEILYPFGFIIFENTSILQFDDEFGFSGERNVILLNFVKD